MKYSRKYKMLFKFGVTVIVLVAIVIYFVGNKRIKENGHVDDVILQLKDKIKEERGENKEPELNRKIDENSKNSGKDGETSKLNIIPGQKYKANAIHLCVVVCGDRFPEVTVLLKSAVILTTTPLVFHIFAEKELQKLFKDHLEFWPKNFRSQVDYFIYDLQFPDDEKWKQLFKPCASQRLFLPQILTDVDSLIYVDSDVLFISPIDQLYHHFTLFNSTQLAGFTPESEDLATGWYNRFARHPYYGVVGVNSGVMLMNLTRLRQSQFLSSVKRYYDEYHLKLTWGDQDLINIYFHYYPHEIFILSCDYNYRADHCMYMSVCKKAEVDGVKLLHGSRRIFFNEKQPAFKAVYTALKEHPFTSSVKYALVTKLKRLLKDTEHTSCGKLGSNKDIFTKQFELIDVV